jgi:hypothetical protein
MTAADRRWRWIPVVLLFLLHAGLAWTSIRHKSQTYDEVAHLTAGYAAGRFGDYRLSPDGGQLLQRWAALPLLVSDVAWPDSGAAVEAWRRSNVWSVGHAWFYGAGNDPDKLLGRSRAMALLSSLAVGALVFAWSLRLFGWTGGLLSLSLWAFSPTMLAHGRLVTPDVTSALFLLASVAALWALLQRVTPGRLLMVAGAVSAAVLTKYSSVLLLPMAALLVAWRVGVGSPLPWGMHGRRMARSRASQLGLLAAAGAVVGGVVVLAIWGAFGFRFHPVAGVGEERALFFGGWADVVSRSGRPGEWMLGAAQRRLLPEAFLYGFAYTLSWAQARVSFLLGEHSDVGFRTFFPVLVAVKTPVATLLLVGAGIGAGLGRWRAGAAGRYLYRTAPLWVLILVYGGFALLSNLNIGHRHLLPLYPAFFILAGGLGSWIRRSRLVGTAALVLVLSLAVETLLIHPHYLAYFNVPAGGARRGWRIAVDSSLDWGQDLPLVRRWLDDHDVPGETPLYLSYFGTASPLHYGLGRARRLPSYSPADFAATDPRPLTGGIYAVSVTMLQQVYNLAARGRWNPEYERNYGRLRELARRYEATANNPAGRAALIRETGSPQRLTQLLEIFDALRFGRLCTYLRGRKPDAELGHTIHIYVLDDEEVQEALFSEPREMYPDRGVRTARD